MQSYGMFYWTSSGPDTGQLDLSITHLQDESSDVSVPTTPLSQTVPNVLADRIHLTTDNAHHTTQYSDDVRHSQQLSDSIQHTTQLSDDTQDTTESLYANGHLFR